MDNGNWHINWAEYIKLYRRMNDLTQAEFADLVGCTRRCVSEWEAGKTYPQKNKQLSLMGIFEPVMPELSRELEVKREIRQKQSAPDSRDAFVTSLQEYAKLEPQRYELMLAIHDLSYEDVEILSALVQRMVTMKMK